MFGEPLAVNNPTGRRMKLQPLNRPPDTQSQPFNDYDGGSGGNYQAPVPISKLGPKIDESVKKQVMFQQEEEQGEKVVEQERLQAPVNHQSAMTHANYLTEEHIRSCYPTGAKVGNFLKQAVVCRSSTRSYVDQLHEVDRLHPESFQFTQQDKDMLGNKTMTLKILQTSALELDSNVCHPFVRIHIINMVTGCYIQKINMEQNCVYNYESNGVTEVKETAKEKRSCELEFIPPFATNCCDMRQTGNPRAVWNEEILINEYAEQIFNPECILLFELLDFVPMYLQARKNDNLDCDNFYRIAWGYFRPFGLAKLHLGTIRIQLHRYIFETKKLNSNDRKECTPLVYYDFIWPGRTEYNGVLNVLFLVHEKPQFTPVFENSRSVYEIEQGDRELKKKMHQNQVEQKSDDEKEEELTDQDKANLRRRRFTGEKSQIPENILHKFASAPLGCYRLAFNKKGNYLAAACTYKSSKTIIKLFDVEQGIPFGELKGHSNLIHDIKFSPQSQFLLTVSSDQTGKVWRVPKHSGETIEEDESDRYLIAQLSHPSYVYAGIFLQEGVQPLIVTACFDSRIRFWKVDSRNNLVIQQDPQQQEVISVSGQEFDNFQDLLDHRHPNCIAYDGSRRMYVGDSMGAIHIYDINSTINSQFVASRISFVLNPEMQGDAINSLCLIPLEMKDLLVHSRDNCIRVLEVNSSEGKYSVSGETTGAVAGRFFGTVTQKLCIRSTVSPCGEYILSGSEDGKPHLWDNVSITQPVNQFQYSLMGPVADVAWNETYHMIALAGFGDEHPIIVYVWERNEEMNLMEYKELQEKLITQGKKKTEDEEINEQPQGASIGGPFGGPFGGQFGGQQPFNVKIPSAPQSVIQQSGPFSGPFEQPQPSYSKGVHNIGGKPY